jgi:hypothetical protein
MMKKMMALLMALVVCTGAAWGGMFSEDPGELVVGGQLWFPGEGDDDLFDLGYGAQVSYREWFHFPWGVGLNLGVAQWDVDSSSTAYKHEPLTDYKGDALLVYAGPALYFSVVDWDNWSLVAETGVQFVYIDSDVSFVLDGKRYSVDIDEAILWHIGLEYEYMLGENVYVLVGGGYQMDIMAADTKFAAGKLRDTHLHGGFARLGVKFLF